MVIDESKCLSVVTWENGQKYTPRMMISKSKHGLGINKLTIYLRTPVFLLTGHNPENSVFYLF